MADKAPLFDKSQKWHLKLFGSLMAFMALSIATAAFLHVLGAEFSREPSRRDRHPASVAVTDESGEPLYWEESIDDLDRQGASMRGRRMKAVDSSQIFISVGETKEKVRADEADRRTGIKTKRARRAKFVPEALYAGVRNRGRVTILNLFDDTKLRVILNAPSAYRTNQGVYNGVIADDPDSKVHLFVEDDHINGFIETSKQKFRVLDSGLGDSYIIEEAAPAQSSRI